MAKAICYVCKEMKGYLQGGPPTYTVKDYWTSPHIPKGMIETDRVCFDCYSKVKKDVLEYKKEHKMEIKNYEKKENLEQEIIESEIKGKWDKSSTIEYKDEYCAILQKMIRNKVQFIKAFSDLTKEGYRLMTQDEGSSISFGGVSGGMNSYYYFQKIKYVQ